MAEARKTIEPNSFSTVAGKIRVLTIVSGLAIGEPLGGAERFGIELASHLNREKFEAIVCAFWHRGVSAEQHWEKYLANAGVHAFFAVERGGGFTLSRYIRGLKNIMDHLRGIPISIIHSHFQLGSVTALFLRQTLGAKVLVRTAHGPLQREWSNTLFGFLCRQIFTQWIFPGAFDIEVGVSQAVVSSLDRRWGARIAGKRTLLIHNGICLKRFKSATSAQDERLAMGFSPDDLVVGSIGRLSEQKGYTYLIEAVPTVITAFPNARFLIIGDGELRNQLRCQAARLGLSDIIVFTGPRQDVESMLKMMDLFVLPSLWEGLPTVILESMASGVPVVATDIPGTRELIWPGETGWLARPRDPMSLATCIIEALSNPAKRAAVAQKALQDVVPRFSIQHIAKRYEQLYYSLLKRWESCL